MCDGSLSLIQLINSGKMKSKGYNYMIILVLLALSMHSNFLIDEQHVLTKHKRGHGAHQH